MRKRHSSKSSSQANRQIRSGRSGGRHNHIQTETASAIVRRFRQNNRSLTSSDITKLQRTIGNHAVLQMMSASRGKVGGAIGPDVENTIQRAEGSGLPLPPRIRSQMENAFGTDFSQVEIHHDGQADRLNDRLKARAFTSGPQIFFKQDQYRPHTSDGQRLLAHELTHVVQQGAAGVKTGSVAQRSALSDTDLTISSAGERPLIQGSFLKKVGSFFKRIGQGIARVAKNAFRFIRSRLKQSCGGKIDEKDSKNILEQAFKGKKFKVDKIKVVDEAGIKKAWDAIYGKGSYDGTNGQEPDGPLEGFTAPDNTIYINSSLQAVDTLPHEILHRHENGAVINQMGENFNEGFTEYLTQKAVSEMGYKPTSSYPDDLAVVKKLVPIIGGDKALENAYFEGDLDTIRQKLDKKKGAGAYALLVAAMKVGDYAKAQKILDAKDVR